jgi:hypothetical protein
LRVSKRDRQLGDNIPCERGFADHASASATLPDLHPMSTIGGAGTTTLEIGSTVFLMGWDNTIAGSTKPIGIIESVSSHCRSHPMVFIGSRRLSVLGRGEMNMRSVLILSKQCDDYFEASVVSSDPIITAACASLKARDEISPKTRRPRHYGVELSWLLSPYGENQ